jgi:hypothetical protein
MIVPSLKCVAWGARIVVVGFAAGTIEKVRPHSYGLTVEIWNTYIPPF